MYKIWGLVRREVLKPNKEYEVAIVKCVIVYCNRNKVKNNK